MKRANSLSDAFLNEVSKKPTIFTKEQEHFMEEQDKKEISPEDFDLNPYQDDKFLDDSYIQLSEVESNADSVSAEEDCLLAEIEYYREKAAYYRMQKNLVALEASKMKRILSQMGLML